MPLVDGEQLKLARTLINRGKCVTRETRLKGDSSIWPMLPPLLLYDKRVSYLFTISNYESFG